MLGRVSSAAIHREPSNTSSISRTTEPLLRGGVLLRAYEAQPLGNVVSEGVAEYFGGRSCVGVPPGPERGEQVAGVVEREVPCVMADCVAGGDHCRSRVRAVAMAATLVRVGLVGAVSLVRLGGSQSSPRTRPRSPGSGCCRQRWVG